MSKYHVNSETGNTGVCRAEHFCPFGDLSKDHYDTKYEAQAAYETKMAENTFAPIQKLSYEDKKAKLKDSFEKAFPGLKVRQRRGPADELSHYMRKGQEVLLKASAKSTYDADFNQARIEKWAKEAGVKARFNDGSFYPRGPQYVHVIINQPPPGPRERIDAKKDQIKKLQQEIKKLEKEANKEGNDG